MSENNSFKSRDKFAKQVAETITTNHEKWSESFIFGISGKWGEGKTEFLKKLEEIMRDDFKIIDVNPWKFASDRVSFLRSFILKMPKSKYSVCKRIRRWVNNKNDEERMYFDISSASIHKGWATFSFLLLLIFLVIGFFNPSIVDNIFNEKIKWILTVLLIPFVVWIISNMLSSQRSSKSAETLDNFSDLLKVRLNNYKDKKGILVFVDDLDRVSPGTARDVLDNLRTFFDNKRISFVVTGDHSVLERFLGKELLPDSSVQEQMEEGRRFLKKIFNVYWRLPLPIDSEMDLFLDEIFSDKTESLDSIFKNDADKKILKGYLKAYFDKNFRHIIRFLDSIIFTFDVIKNLKLNENEGESKYYQELSDNPLLVIRILMIQELCAPLFEIIIGDYEFLSDLEYAAAKNNNAEIAKLLNEKFKDNGLTSSQKRFIENFLFESPKFYQNTILTVSDIRPFIHLAADAGLGDSRGPSAEDFSVIFQSENAQQIKQAIVASGEDKLKNGATKFIEVINSSTDLNKKKNLLTVLLDVLCNDLLEYKHVNKIFFDNIHSADLSFIRQLPIEPRSDLYKLFWKWLNFFDEAIDNYKKIFVYFHPDEIRGLVLKDGDQLGYFGSYIVSYWFAEYYKQNQNDALNIFKEKYQQFDNKGIINGLSEIFEDMSGHIITDSNDAYRKIRFDLVYNYAPQEILDSLKDKIKNEIVKLNDNMWAFVSSKLSEYKGFELKYFETAIIDLVKELEQNNFQSLVRALDYASNKLKNNIKEFWDVIFISNFKVFVDNIGNIIDATSYTSIAPDKENAKRIFLEIMLRIKDFDDQGKINVLPYLNKQKWAWSKLDKVDLRSFRGLTRSTNLTIKEMTSKIISSWK